MGPDAPRQFVRKYHHPLRSKLERVQRNQTRAKKMLIDELGLSADATYIDLLDVAKIAVTQLRRRRKVFEVIDNIRGILKGWRSDEATTRVEDAIEAFDKDH